MLNAIMAWERKLALRRSVVLFMTLWMTWRAFEWAAQYAALIIGKSGLEAAAVIGAVTAPIAYLQKAVFAAYIKSKDET